MRPPARSRRALPRRSRGNAVFPCSPVRRIRQATNSSHALSPVLRPILRCRISRRYVKAPQAFSIGCVRSTALSKPIPSPGLVLCGSGPWDMLIASLTPRSSGACRICCAEASAKAPWASQQGSCTPPASMRTMRRSWRSCVLFMRRAACTLRTRATRQTM